MTRVTWTVMAVSIPETKVFDVMRCERCGLTEPLKLPASCSEFTKACRRFTSQHKDCKPRPETPR